MLLLLLRLLKKLWKMQAGIFKAWIRYQDSKIVQLLGQKHLQGTLLGCRQNFQIGLDQTAKAADVLPLFQRCPEVKWTPWIAVLLVQWWKKGKYFQKRFLPKL